MTLEINNRSRLLNNKPENKHGLFVALWLKRDFRFHNNHVFEEAIKYCTYFNVPLKVFVFLPQKLHTNKTPTTYCILYPSKRHLDFLLKTWNFLKMELDICNIPLEYRTGTTPIDCFKKDFDDACVIVTDFKPTTPALKCDANISSKCKCTMIQVDAHNIVPCWIASPSAEYMAKTFRPKLWKHASTYLCEYNSQYTKYTQSKIRPKQSIPKIEELDYVDDTFISSVKSGQENGMKAFTDFIHSRLKHYTSRNDPTMDCQSHMSIYINYGVVSVQKMVYILKNMQHATAHMQTCIDEYIEEVFVRRELADNFCFYKPNYLSTSSAWNWAQKLMKEDKQTKK